MITTKLIEYKNGNTNVTIFTDGSKNREYLNIDNIHINHPESIDVKITDYCDMGCLYCHEQSTIKGNHGNLKTLLNILSELPKGVEIAIGGGNPLDHPKLIWFLKEVKKQGLISNITINQGHLTKHFNQIKELIDLDLVKGIGISITNNNFTIIKELCKLSSNIVFHVIAGINNISILDKLNNCTNNCKVLILGYKTFGRGIAYYNNKIESNIDNWAMFLPKYFGDMVLSFDNLAIEQLDIKRFFTEMGWNKFYMGNDFTFTMYVDAVKQEYAPTSRSDDRISFDNRTLIQYFNEFKTI